MFSLSRAMASFLLQPAVSDVATLLCARDLARMCETSSQCRRAAARLVRTATEAQHGLAINGGTVADLHALEKTQTTAFISLQKTGARKIVHGAELCEILVGSNLHLITEAQDPPRCGDSWSLCVGLKKGRYTLQLRGWKNPAHGILDLFVDNVRATLAGGLNWYAPSTIEHVFRMTVDVKWTGVHHILGRTSRSDAERHRQSRYWMCLKTIEFVDSPVQITSTLAER